jgi:hypothetical protein
MCTAPQNFLIPRDGIQTNEGDKSFDEVAAGIRSRRPTRYWAIRREGSS